MRMKDHPEDDGMRVWLSQREVADLIETPDDRQRMAALMLGARCGLRRKEIVDVEPAHFHETDYGPMLRVWRGKGSRYRETPAPPRLVDLVDTLVDVGVLEPDDRVVGVKSPDSIRRWTKRAAEQLYAESGDKGWTFVTPHDLRRSWGVGLLEDGVVPSLVFEWGGWQSWEVFRDHYLAEFSPDAVRCERAKVAHLARREDVEQARESPPQSVVGKTTADAARVHS